MAYWLAAQATERTRRGFEHFFYECGEAVNGNQYVDVALPVDVESARYAAALLKVPDARRLVVAHWAELTKPETTSAQAGSILNVEAEAKQPKGC